MDLATLQSHYAEIKTEATRLAGDLLDIPRRVVLLAHLYEDSGRNHVFPHIAAHGALWAFGYFEVGGKLGRWIGRRYFYNATERNYRLGLLQGFAEEFRLVNRQVCIDTCTNYFFVRQFGNVAGAETIVPPTLLDALNRVHAARAKGHALTTKERRQVFEQSFRCEQEVTVAPGVLKAVSGFECKIMKFLCLRPIVRFAYFPACKFLMFRDFSNQSERIEKGLRAYGFAEQMGPTHVRGAMREYGVMPRRFFSAPDACFADLGAFANKLGS